MVKQLFLRPAGTRGAPFPQVLPVLALSTGLLAFPLVSVNDEIEIGKQAQEEVRKQVPEVRDGRVRDYVADIGRRLAAHAPGPKYPYSFSVANYQEINAFALPGGPVWLHRGAIAAARNEAELAGVLAHEVAHIAERHAADQMSKALVTNGVLGLLGAVLGSGTGARATEIGASLVANGIFLKFSRDDEREADQVGVDIMHRAGWDPRGMKGFMLVLQEQHGRNPGSVETFFSTHPSPQDRIARLEAAASSRGGGRTDSDRFRDVKARLDRMPPAESMPRR